jgi:hypothetical protein
MLVPNITVLLWGLRVLRWRRVPSLLMQAWSTRMLLLNRMSMRRMCLRRLLSLMRPDITL